ncbi:alpha/beta hydrolase [Diaphorobacter aerolatus]|uniref:Alpha/beta hydrolase n=1 Tax=Diaphorobacter aerolatus TaxID=1288495 RepID=A0A7H0GQV8_9BURK|nr:alpha/beta hydrolase [Diaphorobacter aerolatus]QNP50674.1 alpha/beta hydrolase [Diaphorobacter aerolatus]
MRNVIERMARANHAPMHTLSPAEARAFYEMGSGVLEVPKAVLPRVEDFTIRARDGYAIPARLYAPSLDEKSLPLLLYTHGGGFTIGSIRTHDTLCRELARLANCMVVSIDYRLSPEHRFPVATHDAWDALQWLAVHAAELGADARRLAVGGDSAGGTLAAVNAIQARHAGIALSLQLLFYPGTTAHQDTESHKTFAHGLVLEEDAVSWYFDNYIPNKKDREDWRFAPLLAPDVDDIAPAWIGLAELDPLVDEGIAYADKLRLAGVQVSLEIYRGVTHEFIKMGRALPEARQAHADAARALREAFA